MDIRSIIRPIIVALVSIGLIILVIVLIVQGFSGGGPDTTTKRVDVSKYAYRSAIAMLLVDGPINLDQDHRQVRISVSGTINEINIIQGYQGTVIERRTYPNNTAGYGAFLQALQLLGFSRGVKLEAAANKDYRGQCPAGSRYTYSFSDGQDELFSYWSTSCGNQGTFRGQPSQVRQLFERQIPPRELNKLLGGVKVNM